jgi:acyl transferase domain-containing protein
MRGANIDIAIGGNGRDGDFVHRFTKNVLDPTTAHYLESAMIKFNLGLGGKAYIIDTACSASNIAFQCIFQDIRRNAEVSKNYGMANEKDEEVRGLAMGSVFVNDVMAFIGLSQAHMLGNTGRSKTFDGSADGYARGEGVGAGFVTRDDDVFECYGYALGGITNQDGRSASLTAPNGPSQSAVVRGSLRDAGRHYLDVNVSELHGTGTAIGDPIETGSLRTVMHPDRTQPIFHQAGKSMTGHLEFGAGITGIIKTLMCGMHSTVTGNCHFKNLNPNIDANGYPGIWPNECVDLNRETNHCGISSFGFGGSNARVDLWMQCRRGMHRIAPVGPTAIPKQYMAIIDKSQ